MSAAPRKTVIDSLVARSEHISLESEVAETRAQPNFAAAIATFKLQNPARGVTIEIAILQEHYVVTTIRRRSEKHAHYVDLRFVDPKPVAFRHIAWRWLYAALASTLLT